MKLRRTLIIALILLSCLGLCLGVTKQAQSQDGVFLNPSDPRLKTEVYSSNGRNLYISNFPSIQVDGQMRFLDLKKGQRASETDSAERKKSKISNFEAVDKDEDKNICLGKSPQENSKTRLEKFIEGPCHPVVLIPG